MARTYNADLPGGTATTTIQCQAKQTFKILMLTLTSAAAGKVELSLSSSSQIGTAQPDSNVIARVNVTATAGPAQTTVVPISLPVIPFQSIYLHQTGAGNIGTAYLCS
jgi:hypothetical protein